MGSYVGGDGAFPRSHTFTLEIPRLLCLSNVYYCWNLDQYMQTKYTDVLTAAYYIPHFCDVSIYKPCSRRSSQTHYCTSTRDLHCL
jgi:hypothetical protein